MYPPASSTRSGEPGHTITGPDGRQFPTDGFPVRSNSHAIYRDPDLRPEPDKFRLERWLVKDGDQSHPQKGALQSLDSRLRSCTGQELAMLELKLVSAMTARVPDTESVYDE